MAPENCTIKLTAAAENDPCLRRRTMNINVQDDTFKDVNNLSLVLNTLEDNSSSGSDSRTFALMVEPDETIAAVKAYIQEEKGIPFKKQKLLNEFGRTLRDAQALGIIKEDSTLILRYAPATQIVVRNVDSGRALELMVGSDDTIGDVKAAIYEKEGIRFHKQRLIFRRKECGDSELLADLGIQLDSELILRLI
ncbi:PREDICTED: polyubiquitin 8-like [Nicotiana attenuata]|uniref:Polyubiquitin 4 n=1 Tax=Nicotiana attenuata TaxID=49451 RepID=A0A314KY04_NICAT|nr:PREDICTED: polyubiquitin 8-like [Nicotiana attenuata]OIT33887.1 polyubiquitin 4 [Nicotiana attenuata]